MTAVPAVPAIGWDDIRIKINGEVFTGVTAVHYRDTPTRPRHYVCQHCSEVVPDGLPRMRHHGFVICAVCAVDTGLATVAEVAKWTGTVVDPDGNVTVSECNSAQIAAHRNPVTYDTWTEPGEGD